LLPFCCPRIRSSGGWCRSGEDEAECFQSVGPRLDGQLNLIDDSGHLEPEERAATLLGRRELADPRLEIVLTREYVAETIGQLFARRCPSDELSPVLEPGALAFALQ
jgi:hypothetical protein